MASSSHVTSLASSLLLDKTQVKTQHNIKNFVPHFHIFFFSRPIFSLWPPPTPCMHIKHSSFPSCHPSPPSPAFPAFPINLLFSSSPGLMPSSSSWPLNVPTGRIKPVPLKTFLALFWNCPAIIVIKTLNQTVKWKHTFVTRGQTSLATYVERWFNPTMDWMVISAGLLMGTVQRCTKKR